MNALGKSRLRKFFKISFSKRILKIFSDLNSFIDDHSKDVLFSIIYLFLYFYSFQKGTRQKTFQPLDRIIIKMSNISQECIINFYKLLFRYKKEREREMCEKLC